jgi:hypothetical protein
MSCGENCEWPHDPNKTGDICGLCANACICERCHFRLESLEDIKDLEFPEGVDHRASELKAGERVCLECAVHPRLCSEIQKWLHCRFWKATAIAEAPRSVFCEFARFRWKITQNTQNQLFDYKHIVLLRIRSLPSETYKTHAQTRF